MIYDKGKVLIGVGLFVVLMTFPVWYNLATGKGGTRVQLTLPKNEKNCVMPTAYMRASHMDLLNQWRDDYVRRGDMIHTAPHTKRTFVKSLGQTCMSAECHAQKSEFCDRCHTYSGVSDSGKPGQVYCWDCHSTEKGAD